MNSRPILEPKQASVGDFKLLPEVNENCTLLVYYAASSGDSLRTFRDILSVPSSGVNNPLQMGWISCPATSMRNYHYSLRNNLEDCSSHAPVLWIPAATFRGIERQGLEPDRLFLSTVDLYHHGLQRDKCIILICRLSSLIFSVFPYRCWSERIV